MKKIALLALAASALTACGMVDYGHTTWGYDGDLSPEKWAELDESFVACSAGKNQSPINITNSILSKLPPITFDYDINSHNIVNNGHTVQVNFTEAGGITIEDHAFKLLQMHFHAPSENQVGGKSFPLEAHLVHADNSGNLAVVAVLFERGQGNPALKNVWDKMPKDAGDSAELTNFSPADILPHRHKFYRYNGSLTTPPCSEGVRWIVFRDAIAISENQVQAFAKLWAHPNNRPIQPLNARIISK